MRPAHPSPARPAPLAAAALAGLAWLLLPGPAAADSLRCQGGLVAVGDAKLDLLGKCGRPALVERRAVERAGALLERGPRLLTSQVTEASVERWTYNFGPRRFVQYVTLEGGRVTAVERGGYGYDLDGGGEPAAIPRARCDHLSIHEGDRAFDLLARCGEPASRDVTLLTRRVLVRDGAPDGGRPGPGGPLLLEGASVTVTVEIWTYDFGPQILARLVELEDGVVTRVETASHGYSRLGDR